MRKLTCAAWMAFANNGALMCVSGIAGLSVTSCRKAA